MSKYFVEQEDEGTINLFNKRYIYKSTMYGSYHNNIVSFIDGEKIYYGRIDRRFVPINAATSAIEFLKINVDPVRPQQAMNFVSDMFEQLCTQFQKAYAQGKLNRSDPHLGALKAHKGYVNPRTQYRQFQDIFFHKLKNIFDSKRIRFSNFDQFIGHLMPILENSVDRQPITYTGYVKSRNCTVMNSGLAIEIADLGYTNDAEKIANFKQSMNWEYYVNTCDTYGFMIDYNIPWRIVADIGSDAMLEAARKRGYSNVESILQGAYGKASKANLRFFTTNMLQLYNMIKKDYTEILHCSDGSMQQKRIKPQTYSQQELEKKYSQEYFLELYMKLRIMEEQPKMTENEIKSMIYKEIEIFRSTGKTNSIHKNFESVINKTFDKIGSLTYAIKSDILRKQENFEQGDLDALTIDEGGNDISGY